MLVVEFNFPQTFILPPSFSRATPQHHSGIPKNHDDDGPHVQWMIIVIVSKDNDVQENEILFRDQAALVSYSLIFQNFSFKFQIISLSSR